MIRFEPNVDVKRNGSVNHNGSWRVYRDGQMVGYCWKGEYPVIATIAPGVFSESDINDMSCQLGNRPKISEPPKITAQQWREFKKRVRKR